MRQPNLVESFDRKLNAIGLTKLANPTTTTTAPVAPRPMDNVFSNVSHDLQNNPYMIPLAMGGLGMAQDLFSRDKDEEKNPIKDALLYGGAGFMFNKLLERYNVPHEQFAAGETPAPPPPGNSSRPSPSGPVPPNVGPGAGGHTDSGGTPPPSDPSAPSPGGTPPPNVGPGAGGHTTAEEIPAQTVSNPAGRVNRRARTEFDDGHSGHSDRRAAGNYGMRNRKSRNSFTGSPSSRVASVQDEFIGEHEKLAYIRKHAFIEELQSLGVIPMDKSLQDELMQIKFAAFNNERRKIASEEMKNGLSGSIRLPGGSELKPKEKKNPLPGAVRPTV